MKKSLLIFLTAIFSMITLHAQGTPPQAEALVKKAIQFYKANGKAKAFEEFSNTSGKFVSGDLYVFVYDLTGKCVAHGGNPKMVGKDLLDMKDADGKAFVQERISIAKSKGKGWQNYKWTNPKSKKIEEKTAYIEKVDDIIIGCGAYKK
jgi:signal transduction histidine kinase